MDKVRREKCNKSENRKFGAVYLGMHIPVSSILSRREHHKSQKIGYKVLWAKKAARDRFYITACLIYDVCFWVIFVS